MAIFTECWFCKGGIPTIWVVASCFALDQVGEQMYDHVIIMMILYALFSRSLLLNSLHFCCTQGQHASVRCWPQILFDQVVLLHILSPAYWDSDLRGRLRAATCWVWIWCLACEPVSQTLHHLEVEIDWFVYALVNVAKLALFQKTDYFSPLTCLWCQVTQLHQAAWRDAEIAGAARWLTLS